MVNEYKKIVLLTGLEHMNDYHFRMVKSLLAQDLKLINTMQDDYDRIKIADLMEDKFQMDAGLNKLIQVCKDIPGLEDLVENLRKGKQKVLNKMTRKIKTESTKRKQDKPGTSQAASIKNETLESKPTTNTPSSKVSSEEHHLLELPTTGRCLAISAQTLQQTQTTAFSSLPAPQTPPEMSYATLMTSPGPSTASYTSFQTTLGSPATASSSLLTFQVPSTPSFSLQSPQASPTTAPSHVQVFQVPPRRLSSGAQDPRVSPEMASTSINISQVSPTTLSSSLLAPGVSQATACRCHQALPLSPAPVPKKRMMRVPKKPSEEDGYQQGPKEVMVLKATRPFIYDMKGGKMMFHATVATTIEFFRVKVFNTVLENRFIPNNIISISNYFGYNGFLEIHSASSVSVVKSHKQIDIPSTLRQRATETPKIAELDLQRRGRFVNGIFMVYKKRVWNEAICYGIQDNTGKMRVEVCGRLTSVQGDKLRLFCFELTSDMDKQYLRSGPHSYMQKNMDRI